MKQRRQRKWQAGTIGGARCHAALAKLLAEQSPMVARRVARALCQYHTGIVDIALMPRKAVRFSLAKLWRDKYYAEMEGVDAKVRSLYRNCVVTAFRKLMRGEPLNHQQRFLEKQRPQTGITAS